MRGRQDVAARAVARDRLLALIMAAETGCMAVWTVLKKFALGHKTLADRLGKGIGIDRTPFCKRR